MSRLLIVTALLSLAGAAKAADPPSASTKSEIEMKYGETARKIIAAALRDTEGMARLEYLCDRIGNRVTGSESLESAVRWAANEMKNAGLENVQTPPVKVPRWVRGKESATLLAPVNKRLWMMG